MWFRNRFSHVSFAAGRGDGGAHSLGWHLIGSAVCETI